MILGRLINNNLISKRLINIKKRFGKILIYNNKELSKIRSNIYRNPNWQLIIIFIII